MPSRINQSNVKMVEKAVGRYLDEGPVYLRVTLRYDGPSKTPSLVQHQMFRMGAEGMEPIPAGDISTNNAVFPSKPVGAVVKPRDFMSPDPNKGVVNPGKPF